MIEDLGSGNGTYVNEQTVTRHFLGHQDVIRVCNAKFEFQEQMEAPEPESITMVGTIGKIDAHIVQTVDAKKPIIHQDAQALTNVTSPAELVQMASRLKTIYAVSDAISSILDLDELLPEILNRLFEIFPRAERAIVLLTEEGSDRLLPKAVKRRNETDKDELKLSQTILREVLTTNHAVLSHDALEDKRFKSGRSVANFGIRAMIASPLIFRGEALGVVYLDSQGIAAFKQADLELLTGIAHQAAGALGNAKLHEELLKRQRIEQDMHLAERIQQSFLPRRIPQIDGYTFSARYDPAYEVGGDFYDFVRLPDDRIGIVVGDVSGKGVAAALYMARLGRDLRYFALAESDPARVLKWMNRAVNEAGQDHIFVTLVYVVLSAKEKMVTIANAGHMPPILRHQREGQVRNLDTTAGLPLGVLPDTEYEAETHRLEPGDSMMLYTDGLVEAMDPKRQMFGIERLLDTVAEGPSTANTLLVRAVQACQAHVADAAQFDDTTIVCFGLDTDVSTKDIIVNDSTESHVIDRARAQAMRRIRRMKPD